MRKTYSIRNLIVPLVAVGLFFWLLTAKADFLLNPSWRWLLAYNSFLTKIFGVGLCLSAAWLFNNLLKTFVWYWLLERYFEIIIPQLIKDFTGMVIYFIAILVIISQVFGESITALLAASGLMGLVIGMAVQNIISDLFSGITLNFDENFHIGDAVTLHDINKKGYIREITWRSTRLETEGTGLLIIPNSLISTMAVTNTTQHRIDRSEVSITLSANIPAEEAVSIMNSGLKNTKDILPKPAPFARVSRFDSDGVVYKLFYWIENTKVLDRDIRHALLLRITSEFVSTGISLSRNRTAEEEMALLNTLENLQ